MKITKENEVNTVTEYINEDITLSDETFNLMSDSAENSDIGVFSATNSIDSTWNELFSEQFGDDY